MSLGSTHDTRIHPSSSRRVQLRLRPLEERNLLAAGGGFTDGGIVGEYFANAELAGDPAFVRRDVRIDFDWLDRSPGGSTSPSFTGVGADNFSVRWTGQIIPRVSQTYTFQLTGDDGARLWIRPTGGAFEWNLIVDAWDVPAEGASLAPYQVIGGRTYDVRVEYRELEGTATARLAWSGPGTPEEVIEPAVQMGIIPTIYDYYLYADAGKTGRPKWGDLTDYFNRPAVETDSLGWPMADSGHLFWSGRDSTKTGGTYLLRFTGQAEVTGWYSRGMFRVGDAEFGRTLPVGAGYDPTTNTTTAIVVIESVDLFGLNFVNTQRTPEDLVGTGVTNVELIRPLVPNGDTTYEPGELFDVDVKKALGRFTTLRFLTANYNPEKEWIDRKLPASMQAAWGDRASVWEYNVMLANETGKDLYITIPVGASADYINKLALLIRYGSDGVEPYAEAVADPVYPALNSNLRVYVEWGNEFWNWAFAQAGWANEASRLAVVNNTPDGQIINYDGQRNAGDFRRWAALRTIEASNIFRGIWGDVEMGDRVRVLFEYQYDNQQNTAVESLRFIDRYFNNGDGTQHVADPHPVNYYIWGAGGAAYFGAANARGLITDIIVPGGTFENIRGNPGGLATTRPTGSPWTFTEDSGIYREWAGIGLNVPMDIAGVGKVPSAINGMQAMYLSGKASASVTITFSRPGTYAIDFQAAGEIGLGNLLKFKLNDQEITSNGAEIATPSYPWWPGTGNRDSSKFSTYGTLPFQITTPGKYVFRIEGQGTADQTTVIDDLRIASLDAIFKSRIPSGVRWAGEESRLDMQAHLASQASFAQAYGLKVVAYEGGWSLGSDTGAVPIMSWAKYRDPRAATAMANAIDAFHQAGGEIFVLGTYDQWYLNDAVNADLYPLIKGIDNRLKVLPASPIAKLVLTTSSLVTISSSVGVRALSMPINAAPGDWVSWTVRITNTGDYRINAKAAPDGWSAIYVDGVEIGNGSSGLLPGGVVRLSPGLHTFRVQSTGGWYLIRGLTIDRIDDEPIK